ncbi:MAG: hypothetical protein NT024_01140 [Proteobacteria bacterium]|nr:hypothetical protein [Pseudomonadota bacterium]
MSLHVAVHRGVPFERTRGRTQTFDDDQCAHFVREQRRMMCGDLPAETVADHDRHSKIERPDDPVQVVDKMRDRVLPAIVAIAVAAQLRQHDVPSTRQRFGNGQQTRGHVPYAVHDHQRRIARIAECQHVQCNARGFNAMAIGFVHGVRMAGSND